MPHPMVSYRNKTDEDFKCSFKYSKLIRDKKGQEKKVSFIKVGHHVTSNQKKYQPSGSYHYLARCLRGGCTGWGDVVDPAFPLFNVS